MSLVLIRHTRPEVAAGVCYGRTDLDVAGTFPDDAREVIGRLGTPDRLVSSPLRRCRRLAEAIAAAAGLTVEIDARLQEMDFGAWEGQLWSQIPKSEIDQWAADFLHARPHGGESVAMLRARTLAALRDYRRNAGQWVVVTHAGVIKSALAGGDGADSFATDIAYGGIVELNKEQE